jgi:release factor glutamine methyltransferase
VDETVLDPRGDTETLIAACLELGPQTHVLDLGTGSGAIGLTLAAEWQGTQVLCSDLSQEALGVAAHNAERFELSDRVMFLRSDWYTQIEGAFDLIVSNPPYIALSEWEGLDPEVRGFDPRMALTDEDDGLTAYRIICGGAPEYLTEGGRLNVEIGHAQGRAVQALFADAGFTEIKCLPDMAGRDRVVCGVRATA